jgi:hypothetical protein
VKLFVTNVFETVPGSLIKDENKVLKFYFLKNLKIIIIYFIKKLKIKN